MPEYPQETLLRLLDLQEQDTAIKRLEERRAALPEAQRLEELRQRLAMLESDVEIATKQNDEVGREQHRLEGEIELMDGKIGKDEQRVYSGAVSNPKELSSLQANIEQEKRQKSTIEDSLLEVMEQKEQAAATLEKLTVERDSVTGQVGELDKTVTAMTSEIDGELEDHRTQRTAIASEIPDDLLALYDKLREQKAGVGAAVLKAGTCEGCHTKLPAREWEQIRHDKGFQRCENCRRILVVHA